MNSQLYKEYALLKAQIDELEAKSEKIRLEIYDDMDGLHVNSLQTQFGGFQIAGRTTYEYSLKVKAMEEKVKKAKKIEELKGIATIKSVSQSLRFFKAGEKV